MSSKTKPSKQPGKFNLYLWLLGILILTILVYSKVLNFDFVLGWDDELQVVNNNEIKEISWHNLNKIFSSYYVGMYQPLSTFTYALEYKYFDSNAWIYHFSNLILHLLNVILVFFLFRKLTNSSTIVIIVTFLFALHPMNVESVAWISTRSNLLFSFFFLLGLINYAIYLKNTLKWNALLLTFVFFILSVFSKATAIIFPIVLLLFDYYYNRKFSVKLFIEKIPFLAVSITLGLVAMKGRDVGVVINNLAASFTILDQIIFKFYALGFYIIKLIFPLELSAIHYYPSKLLSASYGLTFFYYLSAVIVPLLIIYFIYYARKKILEHENRNIWVFGISFFAINIALLLQFIPVGFQIVTERYVYLSYLGFYFILAHLTAELKGRYIKNFVVTTIVSVGLLIAGIAYSALSYQRTSVWENHKTLMADVKKQNLDNWHVYLVNGDGYALSGNFNEAMNEYDRAVRLNPYNPRPYINRAAALAKLGRYKESITDNAIAISLNADQAEVRFNIGLAYYNMGKFNDAKYEFTQAVEKKPDYFQAYLYRGNSYGMLQEFQKAITDFNEAIKLDSRHKMAYYSRGVAHFKMNAHQSAIDDFNKVLKLDPLMGDAYLSRGVAYLSLGLPDKACTDLQKAKELGNPNAEGIISSFCLQK